MDILNEKRFDFMDPKDKDFVSAFDLQMEQLGYSFGNTIGSGYCWGRHMLIYRKAGAKSPNVYARIYIRDRGLVLRLFLNQIDEHLAYIEKAPDFIKEVFVGKAADCQHCRPDVNGTCRFRKSYTIDGRLIEKCNGITFEFREPTLSKLDEYIKLFLEFFPKKGKRKTV